MQELVSLSLITAPSGEPLSRTEAKLYLRVETTADDALIDGLIVAARQMAEARTQRRLVSQTWEAKFKDWPESGDVISLPYAPLGSITHIKYYDGDGTEQTLSTDVYEAITSAAPGEAALKPGQSWPGLQSDKRTPITVRYVCGYANAAAVPDSIKQGMYMLIAHWYKNREAVTTGTIQAETMLGADALFHQNAIPWVWA